MCKYNRIGCPWRGPVHERQEHESQCAHPNRSGLEVMEALKLIDEQMIEERKLYDSIFDLLSFEKIIFNGKNKFNSFLKNLNIRQPFY